MGMDFKKISSPVCITSIFAVGFIVSVAYALGLLFYSSPFDTEVWESQNSYEIVVEGKQIQNCKVGNYIKGKHGGSLVIGCKDKSFDFDADAGQLFINQNQSPSACFVDQRNLVDYRIFKCFIRDIMDTNMTGISY